MADAKSNEVLTVKLDYKTLTMFLVALNLLTILLWRPWISSGVAKTISVSGEATVEAEPDEFQLNPTYNVEAKTEEAVISAITKKSNEVVDGLKEIGVADKDIKLDANSGQNWWYDENTKTNHGSIYLTVKAADKDTAQKIQDFLLTTKPEGQLTAYPTFSDELTKTLEKQAREEAIADAKAKAEQSATELGQKVGKVVSVSEGYGFAEPYFGRLDEAVSVASDSAKRSIPIKAGQNELSLSVQVVFEIK